MSAIEALTTSAHVKVLARLPSDEKLAALDRALDEGKASPADLESIMHKRLVNFQRQIGGWDQGFVLLYAPWCGACHQYIPAYLEMASQHPEYHWGALDAFHPLNRSIAEMVKLDGYPSVIAVHKGKWEVVPDVYNLV